MTNTEQNQPAPSPSSPNQPDLKPASDPAPHPADPSALPTQPTPDPDAPHE